MKWAYGKFNKVRHDEAFAVFAITVGVVIAYSAWGSYIMHTSGAVSPQSVSVER